jgi:hypothetical protein
LRVEDQNLVASKSNGSQDSRERWMSFLMFRWNTVLLLIDWYSILITCDTTYLVLEMIINHTKALLPPYAVTQNDKPYVTTITLYSHNTPMFWWRVSPFGYPRSQIVAESCQYLIMSPLSILPQPKRCLEMENCRCKHEFIFCPRLHCNTKNNNLHY